MKKVLLMIALSFSLAFLATSCNKSDNTSCWEFTVMTERNGEPEASTTIKQCDLTVSQAESVRKSLEYTQTVDGITITTTATKKKV